MTVFLWRQTQANNTDANPGAGPYFLDSNGVMRINSGFTVVRSAKTPNGKTQSGGYMGSSSTNINIAAQLIFRQTNYWGLVANSTRTTWTQVRLWEYYDMGGFVGMPRRKNNLPNSTRAFFAAYYLGEYVDKTLVDSGYATSALPVFRYYGKAGTDYFEILDSNEVKIFPLSNSNFYAPGGYQYPNQNPNLPPPPVKPPTSTNTPPDRLETETNPPQIGSGSSSSTTIGNQPYEGGWQPNGSVYIPGIGTFRPPTPSSGNGRDGAWVTAPDGTRVWLPNGIDFEALARAAQPKQPNPETKIVVRMPKGYAAPQSTSGTKPRMSQSYYEPLRDADKNAYTLGLLNGAPGFLKTRTFLFPYIPQNIRYSDIGSEWQEIPRALNAPFVDWNRYKLMKVSMDFLVAGQFKPNPTTPNSVSDGLQTDVTQELNLLREMATSKNPVFLEGFDDILQMQISRSVNDVPRGMQFVINDLNIVAARRTVDPDTGLATSPSKIAAAQVSITLQEIPVETVTLVKLPPLNLGTPIINKGGSGAGGVPSLGLQSSVLTGWQIGPP
jgi:hypothetical protein